MFVLKFVVSGRITIRDPGFRTGSRIRIRNFKFSIYGSGSGSIITNFGFGTLAEKKGLKPVYLKAGDL